MTNRYLALWVSKLRGNDYSSSMAWMDDARELALDDAIADLVRIEPEYQRAWRWFYKCGQEGPVPEIFAKRAETLAGIVELASVPTGGPDALVHSE